MDAKRHYDTHLGNFYSWMAGEFGTQQAELQDFFERNGIRPNSTRVAIDLGAGHGLQSVSLAKLGFSVKAVDFNGQLLAELNQHKRDLDVDIIRADVLDFASYWAFQPELIVCMGDTITHLPSTGDLERLLNFCGDRLAHRGKLVLSFRELTAELIDEQRFIPVRSDEKRILTCFLEYFPEFVRVTDILHEKEGGSWKQKVSSYAKLRLSEKHLVEMLGTAKLNLVKTETTNGMTFLIADKDQPEIVLNFR